MTKKHIVLLSLRGACVPERFFNGGLMRADATSPIMSAHAQVSYLRDEKNVSFELVSEVLSRFLRTFRQPHRPALRCGYPSSSVTSR